MLTRFSSSILFSQTYTLPCISHSSSLQKLRKLKYAPLKRSILQKRRYSLIDPDDDEDEDLEDVISNVREDYPVPSVDELDMLQFGNVNDFESLSAPYQSVDSSYLLNSETHFDEIFKEESLGKYFEITKEEADKYLREGWAGHLAKKEFRVTERTCFMIRKETLDSINWLNSSKEALFTNEAPPPLLLSGDRGVGKSAILNSLVYYARKTGWIVMYIPNAEEWVHSGSFIRPSRIYKDCWDQPRVARTFLENMLHHHSEQLAQIPVRNPTTVISTFDGTTLYDLVEYGITLPEHSGSCAVLLRHELTRAYEFPVLIAIDSYNSIFNFNQEFRNPDSERYIKVKLHNNEMSLWRIFKDAHYDPVLVNGTFVGSLSTQTTFRHFNNAPFHENQFLEVNPYNQKELNSALMHYRHMGYTNTPLTEATEEVIYKITDGRGGELVRYCAML